jgi:hypothetical protein
MCDRTEPFTFPGAGLFVSPLAIVVIIWILAVRARIYYHGIVLCRGRSLSFVEARRQLECSGSDGHPHISLVSISLRNRRYRCNHLNAFGCGQSGLEEIVMRR